MKFIKAKGPVMFALVALLLNTTVPLVAGEHFSESPKGSVIRMAPPAPVFDEKTRLTELASRRARVAQSVGAKGILILFSTEPRVYTNDVNYEYRQENNLYYLTNLKQKGATLVLTPSNEVTPEILFLPRRSPAAETWTGHMYSAEEASQTSGIKEIWEASEFEPFLQAVRTRQPYRPKADRILMSSSAAPVESGAPSGFEKLFAEAGKNDAEIHLLVPGAGDSLEYRQEQRFASEWAKSASGYSIKNVSPVFAEMRLRKSPLEIVLLQHAIDITTEAHERAWIAAADARWEYEVDAQVAYTSYQGTGGIRIGGRARRLLLAWALGDLSKLPFSDDVNSESRVLIHRNIRELVNGIAPFLIYDNDPYIVVSNEGRLFWMMDAFTESATYPYSRHHDVGANNVNYIRNSVKVVIDAYNGTTHFYVFDNQDPLIATYRATFPTLFEDASQMPADLRAHVRYPETLIRVQGEVYGLYHTQSAKVFFQREDVWNVAQQIAQDEQNRKQVQPIDPYFVLMQLPGEQTHNEFVLILPFTPSGRNNLIGWMAGRCDGDNYGKLLIYNFPESRLIDGPLQIEARIDQNSQLSSQFTLWNQQGSHVVRGHLLVIPIGRSLLFVEPIYLKAESSPMPELRLVVLATQDRLGYGLTFDEAMTNLFGDLARPSTQEKTEQAKEKPVEGAPKAAASPSPSESASTLTVQQLINKAVQEFEEYQRLTSQGKLGEAGQKLEQHKRTLEELKKAGARKP